MCEQTEVSYLDGDVVWVKLGSCWWPGHVKDVDKLPEEILSSLKKRPIAAVKFFQEDTFEYVRNLNQICMYNCRKKNEFIKKGLDIYRTRRREGSTVMDKFPDDVATAEKLTGGDPDILRDTAFAPEEKPNYRDIFGGDKKTASPDKKSKHNGSPSKDKVTWKVKPLPSSANGRRTQKSPSLPLLQQSRQITHPRFVSEVRDDSDHVVRIRQQPVSTPNRDEQSGTPSPQYKCHICDFTSSRLNVIVYHNKFHSADAANNGRGVSDRGSSTSKAAGRGRGRPSVSTPSDKPRARSKSIPTVSNTPTRADSIGERSVPKRKLIDESDTEAVKDESNAVSKQSPEKHAKTEKKSPKTPIFGKRKGTKWGGERPVKKKKNDEEIREKLLADWDDEDEEQEEKEIELIKQELSKSEIANNQPSNPVPATSQSESVTETKPVVEPQETVKRKETSCFDFDDAEDANLGSELEERAKKFVENRKIPRIIDDKIDLATKRKCIIEEIKSVNSVETLNTKAVEPVPEILPVQAPPKEKTEEDEDEEEEDDEEEEEKEKEKEKEQEEETETPTVDSEDMDTAFKTLLAETTVPVLPEVPELPSTVTSPPPDVESSLPDIVLDSNTGHIAPDTEISVSTLPDSSGGDHDYSIKKECEEAATKPDENEDKSTKTEHKQVTESAQVSVEYDELELDINSMPVVMTDAIITEEPESKPSLMPASAPIQDLISDPSEKPSVSQNEDTVKAVPVVVTTTTSEIPVLPKSSVIASPMPGGSGGSLVKPAQGTPIKTMKLQATPVSAPGTTVAVSGAISKLKSGSGATVISQKGPGGGKLVIVQTSPGQQSRYTVGKTTQQRVTQQQIVQQAVGGGKVVILTKPQSAGGQQKIITTALSPQQQRILTTSGKLQAQPQLIMTSTGAILTPINPRSVMAKGTKLTPISQQQMRALQGSKQTVGTKFTMQSTQAKVILPTLQKASVTQTSPVRVIGTLKPQSNTILIQTTQGTAVSGTVLSKPVAASSGQLQAKLSAAQPVTRLSTPKPKILTSTGGASTVQRITVPTTVGGKTVQGAQSQSKVLEIRPTGAPRMVVQKVQSPLPAKTGSIGLLTNVSQVKKVSGIYPRAPSIQKINQPASQTQVVQKVSTQQAVQKVITSQTVKKPLSQQKVTDTNIVSKRVPIVVPAGSLQSGGEIASLQALQPSVTVTQSVPQSSMALSTPQSIATSTIPVAQGSSISLPSLQPAAVTTSGTSVITPEHIAQVVAATPSEQLGDGGTATYVLVTIDDSVALQPYDNSTLLTYDGSVPTSEGAARTLYIDPASISTSGDLENIILTIDNSASSSGAVLNLGQTSTMPVNPATSIPVESSASSVFNIGPSAHVSGNKTPQSGGSNQDILAEALANTQVFQPDSAIQDSLTVVNSSQSTVMTPRLLEPSPLLTSTPSTLHQATMLLPSLSTVLPPPNPAGVLETSLTLNQPIMTPLEVPSSAVPTLQAPPPVPSSLELPLTITQPALSVTSQSYSTLPVTASSHSSSESPVCNATLPVTMTEPTTVATANFNPSMPLLSEETDSQCEVDNTSASQNTYSRSSENQQDAIDRRPLENLMQDTGHTVLTSYSNTDNSESQHKDSEVPDMKLSEGITSSSTQSASEPQSAAEAEVSNQTEMQTALESSVVDNSTSDTNHSSSSHLASDGSPHNTPYSLVTESSTSHTETTTPLPSFTEISDSTSSISANAVQPPDDSTFESSSEIPVEDPSSSQFQATAEDVGVRSCYMQSPPSSDEKIVTNDSSSQILDSAPSSCDTDVLTSFEKASEVTGSAEKQGSFSYPPEGVSQGLTDAVVTSVSHSMPLLMDEPMTEAANDSTGSDEPLGTKSALQEDDMRVEQNERSKDQGSLSPTHVPCSDLNDDLDEELPPALSPQRETKNKNFKKDDLVWVRNKKIYWPAVITNVNKKNKKVYVKTVNSPRKCRAYKIGMERVVNFEDGKRNRMFFELGCKNCKDFQSVYNRVKKYYAIKCQQHNLSAVRYLTFDPSDICYGSLPNDTAKAEDARIMEDDVTCTSEDGDDSGSDCVSEDLFDYREPDNITYNYDLNNMEHTDMSQQELKLAETLQGYVEKLGIVRDWSDYMYYVWMPEALMFALQKVHSLNEVEAQHLFEKYTETPT
ncbi:mucin-17-like isoform X2 [Periplaneta americana]|uniref:mucin-17-like isoform X2 n=1 Tax=Periplaneta americana TaxID=6978 RepID=UPI0037E9A291